MNICDICQKFFMNKSGLISHRRWHNLPENKEYQEKIRFKISGKNNANWKGDEAGYDAIHYWVMKNKLKPKYCEECGEKEPSDLSNISGEYKRDINDFQWLCRSCHLKYDYKMGFRSVSEEQKRKTSESLKGNVYWNIGRKHTEETKKMISESLKGKKHSIETRKKMSISQKNSMNKRKFKKGHIPWNKGIPRTEETKRKISETKRRKRIEKM